jgi:NADH dehydrogenase
MRNKVVTVFGGSGFLGRYIIRRLAKAGALIKVGVRHPDHGLFLQTMGDPGQISIDLANIRDDISTRSLIEGSDFVINCVGILFETGKQSFSKIHVESAGRIARFSKELAIEKLIHISALGCDEDSSSDYAQTKAKGELVVREFFPEATIIRPSLLVGAEDNFFNRFAKMAKISPVLPLFGGGKTQFQPVYVDDVAAAIETILESDRQNSLFELAGGRVYTFKDLMVLMLQTIQKKCFLLPLPMAVAYGVATFTQFLPTPLLTYDQVRLLSCDSIISGKQPTFKDLGLQPHSIELILPTYLSKYRGQFC